MRLITIILIALLCIGVAIAILSIYQEEENKMEQKYAGPVLEDHDEDHFRKTGESIKLENGN